WTLKEAYIKARGMGLAIPLDQFSFLLDAARPAITLGATPPDPRSGLIRIAFDPRLGDDAAAWQFEQLALSPRHKTAAAVQRGTGPDVRFVVRETVPLASEPSQTVSLIDEDHSR